MAALFISTAPAAAVPPDLKELLLAYRWAYKEPHPAHPTRHHWTEIQFHPDGTVTGWQNGAPLPKVEHWIITGPNSLKIGDNDFSFDDSFTTFRDLSAAGKLLRKGTRGDPVSTADVQAVADAQSPASSPAPTVQPTPAPGFPSIKILIEQGPNIMDWTLSPLNEQIPNGFRENVIKLRDAILDDAATGAPANACSHGVQFCTAVLADLEEREITIGKAKTSANVHASGALGAHRADFNTSPNSLPFLYNSNWPEFERERISAKARRKATANDEKFLGDSATTAWTQRADELRQNADYLYELFRADLRQSPAAK